MPPPQHSIRAGFSLIELLVVVAMIALLSALAIPALNSTQNALQITRAGQGFSDALSLARQTALSRNRNVAFRLFREPGSATFHAYQIALIQDDGSEESRKFTRLPEGIVVSGNPSHLAGLSITGTTNSPAGAAQEYSELQFRRDGSADLGSATEWLVTIVRERDSAVERPSNFITLTVEPSSGATRVFRP